ncbi:MAG TPA: MFS transporter [Candidatus Faecousia intestinigallinarum]|nr:MFS transporter [Candidatus Faecousia intestinigallinarum]
MATLLLVVIYIAFIGLGIPDSLFGTAWPAIYQDFGAPVYLGSIVSALVSGGTILCSFFSARIIKRFGTAAVSLVSTAITAAALLGFRFAPNVYWMFLFALPLGVGAGAIDTALNNYVALHYKAVHMNFLHCFFGIGVTVGPFFLSFALSGDAGWRGGYAINSYIQIGIALILLLSLPLWKKAGHRSSTGEAEQEVVGFSKLIKQRKVRCACLMFLTSCGIEVTSGMWGSTFLVETKGLDAAAAAGFMTLYYFGIAFGRFLSGLLSGRIRPLRMVEIGQALVGAAIFLLFLPLPSTASGLVLFLIGCGIGPLFPNLLYNTPYAFGKKLSASVIAVQMTASYVGILGAPFLFGVLAQNISAGLFPIYLAMIFLLMMAASLLFQRQQKSSASAT